MKQFIFYIILFVKLSLFSQVNTDEQLAIQFFNNKEYDKAVLYYEKLYDKNAYFHYENYYKCLTQLKDWKKAEKIAKKQIRAFPNQVSVYVDLASVYEVNNEEKKAKEQYTNALKELPNDYTQILSLANSLKQKKLYDLCIEVYEKASRFNAGAYSYYNEKAEIFKEKGDLKSMIAIYLDVLDKTPTEIQNVQGNLQNNLGYDDQTGGFKNPILKQELLNRIQTDPEKIIFTEFLIFIQMQQKDFNGAFLQAKALDKRNKEDGFRLMDLGKICLSNEDYTTSEKCFDYVIQKGKENYYYSAAKIETGNSAFEKLIRTSQPTTQEISEISTKLIETINEFGICQLTVGIIRKLAQIQNQYVNNTQAGIQWLEKSINNPAIDKLSQAECKLDLADLILISGDVWEASLLYSQVEKSFKYDLIGQEAKFKNSKLSFYHGDFKWAKAQLDVLKGSTSKFIANDAMDLSLLIGDAINIDTNEVPLLMFSSADLLILQNRFNEAIQRLDSINLVFQEHNLADDIYFKKGIIFTKLKKYDLAIEAFNRVNEYYSQDIYADDSYFKMAEIYQYQIGDQEKAKAIYQEFLIKYPGSVYTVEARKRFRKLRGDNIN